MKNLTLWNLNVRCLNIPPEENLVICHGHDEVNSSSNLYVCTHNLTVYNLDENGHIKWSKDLAEAASPDNAPLNVAYLTLTDTLLVGLVNGELFTISSKGDVCDMVGVFDCGLLAMEWSPDQELLVLITKEMNMILMSCTYDPMSEVNLFDKEFGEKQFITVGWGKKETQFHGSAGKQAAKVTNEVSSDPNAITEDTVKITWRGDGHLYAIGFTMDGIRRFKVFDREGHLLYTSEKQQGQESNLSWRPSGNLIASTQKLPDKYLVSFFEKNGLKHGEFNVSGNLQVEDIIWSSDSEILTLICQDIVMNRQTILLYTVGNYHWYLKQSLTFNSDQRINKVMWDNDFDVVNYKKLHVILYDSTYYVYEWIWNVDHSRGLCNEDDAVINVIDGNKILVTGFRQTIVPPPMSALEIQIESTINSIHFAPQSKNSKLNPNTFFVYTDDKLIFYEQTTKFPLQYNRYKTLNLREFTFPLQYYNWFWVNSYTVVCNFVDKNGEHNLFEYKIDSEEIKETNLCSAIVPILKIHENPLNDTSVFLQLSNGNIAKYELGGQIREQDITFKCLCPKFNVFCIDDNLHFIGLSHKGNLYIDDEKIMGNVSSYFVHTHFLLLTTLQHVLLCAELNPAGLDAIAKYVRNESDHVYKRKIERGAKIIIVVPNDTRTVFQMPRGNLEAIQPRPLSLKIIGEYLNKFKYHEAFDLMRKQRINLNLFYDHDPDKFVNNIDMFLNNIENNSWLNLFLSDLENIDVTKSMYASSYAGKDNITRSDTNTKIMRICDIVRKHLLKRPDNDNKILPILTTFVKTTDENDLEQALHIIKELKLKESAGSKLPVGSDEALKYLLYMVDVNQLFDVALGMYDFDLVLLVANKSHKDPKEYIPMLNELNEADEDYKKFAINKHLKRYEKAVKSLVQCGPSRYEELKSFVKYHSLYTVALSQFTPDEEIFKEISEDFGAYLMLEKSYTEAGIVYERANNIDKAVKCYRDALEWEMAFGLAQSWPKEKFEELLRHIIDELKKEQRNSEALIVMEKYYKDFTDVIQFAITTGHYRTAMRLCSQYGKHELRNELLLPALLMAYKNLQELIESNWNDFIRHRDRLQVVRLNKTKNPTEALYDSFAHKDSDLYSDVGSTMASSKGSTRSYRSSKNRRKHERKVASLKEGSQYEDVALVMALHALVTSSFDLRLQVREVLIALSCFNKTKEAFVLQTSLSKLLKEMKENLKSIWTDELVMEATSASLALKDLPEGVSGVPTGIATLEQHVRIAPIIKEIHWTLEGLH